MEEVSVKIAMGIIGYQTLIVFFFAIIFVFDFAFFITIIFVFFFGKWWKRFPICEDCDG